jgi:hypothetical protein
MQSSLNSCDCSRTIAKVDGITPLAAPMLDLEGFVGLKIVDRTEGSPHSTEAWPPAAVDASALVEEAIIEYCTVKPIIAYAPLIASTTTFAICISLPPRLATASSC